MPRNTPTWGAQLVQDGRITDPLVQYLKGLAQELAALQTAVTGTTGTTTESSPITITGSDGVTVYGDAESGFQIVGPGSSSSLAVPLSIGEDEIYTVAANTQVLYHTPIDVDGELVVSGELIEV